MAFTNTVNATVDAVQRAINSYYTINDVSLDSFGYDWVPSAANASLLVPLGPVLEVTAYTNIASLFQGDEQFDPSTGIATYALNSTFFGPLDYTRGGDALRQFFNALVSMRLVLPPLHNFAFGSLYRNCLTWQLAVLFDFTSRGQVQCVQRATSETPSALPILPLTLPCPSPTHPAIHASSSAD